MTPPSFFLAPLVFTFLTVLDGVAYACPYGFELTKVDHIRYETGDGKVWRVNVTHGTRRLQPFMKDVTSIDSSKINCEIIHKSPKGEPEWHNIEEPTLLVFSKRDGSVWVQGRIWDYDVVSEMPKPILLFNSPKAPMRIKGLSDVVKVAAGETWILALRRNHTVSVWGWNGEGFFIGKAQKRKQIPNELPPYTLFGFPAYMDIMAYNNAGYARLIDGQVTAWGERNICAKADANFMGFGYRCPLMGDPGHPVRRIWQTPTNPSECNAEFSSGEHWQWPCDNSMNQIDGANNLSLRLTTEKFKKFPPKQ